MVEDSNIMRLPMAGPLMPKEKLPVTSKQVEII